MRIKFKRSSLLVKLIIAILVVFSMVTMITVQRQLSAKQREHEQLQAELAETQQESAELREDIGKLETEDGVMAVAREKLGLVSEGEVTFYDIGD